MLDRDGTDPPRAHDRLTALRLLAERWVPADAREVGDLRRGLLKLRAEYTAEVVLVLSRHRACDRRHVDDLLRPASIKAHVARLAAHIAKLLNGWE